MFKNAIVRIPCPEMTHGLTSASLGIPDYKIALDQHSKYIETLQSCGLDVRVLEPDSRFPDSTFVEDVALCTPVCAILTNPGAPSRNGEQHEMRDILLSYYDVVETIDSPGTLDAGDVMMTDGHFYIGISKRTNQQGADQLIHILERHQMTGEKVRLSKMLHLKSGVSYLENNHMLISGEFIGHPAFKKFQGIKVDAEESYAANSLWMNGTVLVPSEHPKTRNKIEKAGFRTTTLDVSEFQKLDGGLSCLSLRF